MLAESRLRCPDARFAFLGINADRSTDAQEGQAAEPMTRRAVEELVDRFMKLMELDHVLLVSSNSIFEWVSKARRRSSVGSAGGLPVPW